MIDITTSVIQVVCINFVTEGSCWAQSGNVAKMGGLWPVTIGLRNVFAFTFSIHLEVTLCSWQDAKVLLLTDWPAFKMMNIIIMLLCMYRIRIMCHTTICLHTFVCVYMCTCKRVCIYMCAYKYTQVHSCVFYTCCSWLLFHLDITKLVDWA